MARECLSCGKRVPYAKKIDGKKRNLKNRKYCLDCSPFGLHNTKRIHVSSVSNVDRKCKTCDKLLKPYSQDRRNFCGMCSYKDRKIKMSDKIHAIVGDACWYCGYDKGTIGRKVLDFHHIDPAQKKMSVSLREIVSTSWKKLMEEIVKCALLCCRCHREVENGIIDKKEMEQIYKNKWAQLSEKE